MSRALDYQRSLIVRYLMQVIWPAFLASVVTTGVVFSAIDPVRTTFFGWHMPSSREAVYTLGFIVIWLLYLLACTLTWWLTASDALRVARRGQSPAFRSDQ